MPHLALLGDSIFDNGRYVPGCPAIVEQARDWFPKDWRITLLACDGSIASQVANQLERLPPDATHLAVCVGGNDVLENSYVVRESDNTPTEMLGEIHEARNQFRRDYRQMLNTVLAKKLPSVLCTVYDAIEDITFQESLLLSLYNDVILCESIRSGLPVLDLRLICTESRDYSPLSPIEPSEIGGAKIVRGLKQVFLSHDFQSAASTIYGSGI